jgi:hypothetical protein
MFSAIDILYIVLAFCVLWFTAAVFWLIWQMASILKNVNDTLGEAREIMEKIEDSIAKIRKKFESIPTSVMIAAEGVKKVVDYAVDKKRKQKSDIE